MNLLMRNFVLAVALMVLTVSARADMPKSLPGWMIVATPHGYAELVERLDRSLTQGPLGKVNVASATVGAKNIGQTIPGNMVVGVFAPPFAIRMLDASIPAGIEAPLRFYITENADKTATLSWRLPSAVFGAYADGGEKLRTMATELDGIMATIAARATGS